MQKSIYHDGKNMIYLQICLIKWIPIVEKILALGLFLKFWKINVVYTVFFLAQFGLFERKFLGLSERISDRSLNWAITKYMILKHSDTEIQKIFAGANAPAQHITIKIINSIDQIDIFTNGLL